MIPVGDRVDLAILDLIGSCVHMGVLDVELPDGRRRRYRGPRPGPEAVVRVRDTRVIRRLLTLGPIGLADGFVAGDFDTPDLAALTELAALQLESGEPVRLPATAEALVRRAWRSLGRAAAPRGPLEDVVHHYDIGNAFFALWLDPSMSYSSAVFTRDDMSLEEAQAEKYRRLAHAAGLQEGDRVLEIGCGWGGFALYATEALGCHVTAITVSREQLDMVEKRVADRGLADRVEPRLQDFRDVEGSFDRIVSIEMIESIPKRSWAPFFAQLRCLSKPGGTIGLQAITVADRHWQSSDANPDFVRRYVFPGGQVPAISVLRGLARTHGLGWREDHGYGASYARTLRSWREGFDAREAEVAALGYDDPFRRMWRYYLAYCEGGFRAGRVDVRQIVLDR